MSSDDQTFYLCLDQGGHASRALLIDAQGQIHAKAFREINTLRDADRIEHDPGEIVGTLQSVADQVVAEIGPAAARIVAAGFATQRSSMVCWHRSSGAALSPVISWQDTRARDWLVQFKAQQVRVHEITGLMLSPHYGVSKMNWCLSNLPDVAKAHEAGQLVMGPLAAYIANRMLDTHPVCADPANASRSLLWGRKQSDWSAELLALFAIPADCLPDSVPSRYDWGSLTIAERKIPVTVITGDQSAALFAFGNPEPNTVYANLGTGAFVQRRTDAPDIEPGRLLASVVYQDASNNVSVLEGTVNGAGSAINAVCEELGIDQAFMRKHSADWLTSFDELPIFVNAISGLGSPWWLADVDSHFLGTGSAEQKIAAVIESVAFLITVNLQVMAKQTGKPERIVVTGGLGSVDPLLQRIANLAQLPVSRARVSEATSRGLACLLADIPNDWPVADIEIKFTPENDRQLSARFERWRAAMPAVPA